MKVFKAKRVWIVGGKTSEWSVGFSITKRSIDFSLLAYWVSIEFA